MNSTVKTVLFWLLIGVSALLLWEVVKGARDGNKEKEVNVTEFMSDVDHNNVSEITVNGMEVRGKYNDGSAFHTTAPLITSLPSMLKNLQSKSVNITFRDVNSGSLPLQLLGTWAPLILARRTVVLHDPPDADRRKQGAVVRQEPRAAALHAAEESHVQGRGRRR